MLTASSAQTTGRRRSDTVELLILAAPMIGVTISRMLMGFIDFAMVSKMGSVDAQAAISGATLLVFAIGCVGMGISQSVQTYVAQADGRGEPHRCGAYAWQPFYIAGASVIVTLPIVLTVDRWFGWIGRQAQHPPGVCALEIEYLRYALWSIAPMTACMGLENFFNGIKRPHVGLIAVVASLIANAIGNYALIFGKFGAPEMGIGGAALATVLAWLVRLVILIGGLFLPSVRRRFHTLEGVAPDVQKLRDLVRIGGPTAAQWLIDIGAWVVFLQVMLPPFGAIPMAAGNVAIQYMHLSFMPALGIGLALATQVGNAIGGGQPDRAVERVRVARRVIVGYMGVMALVFIVAGRPLAGLFAEDPAVVTMTVYVLFWVAAFQSFDALCITYSFALRGAGDTRVPAMLFAICCWGIFALGGLAAIRFTPWFGMHGPWAMCALYIIVLGLLLHWRFAAGAWRKIRLFKEDVGTAEAALAPLSEPVPHAVRAEPVGVE